MIFLGKTFSFWWKKLYHNLRTICAWHLHHVRVDCYLCGPDLEPNKPEYIPDIWSNILSCLFLPSTTSCDVLNTSSMWRLEAESSIERGNKFKSGRCMSCLELEISQLMSLLLISGITNCPWLTWTSLLWNSWRTIEIFNSSLSNFGCHNINRVPWNICLVRISLTMIWMI